MAHGAKIQCDLAGGLAEAVRHVLLSASEAELCVKAECLKTCGSTPRAASTMRETSGAANTFVKPCRGDASWCG